MTNKNNIGRIPETGTMTAYERWELPSLDDQDEAANEIEIEPVTAEEVEQIREGAYQEGFSQGQEKGYQEGFSKGEQEGKTQGLAEGKKEGKEKGFEKGQKDGLAQAQKDVDAEVKKLADIMSQFDQPLADIGPDVQASLLNVITAVSRTVIHRELQTDSSQVAALLKQGLNQMDSVREQVEVTVNPADLIQIEKAAEEAGAEWKMIADDNILPGGLKLKSGPALVDLTAEHRFQQAILNLLGRTDWAIDLASGHADETQKTMTSLSEGYEVDELASDRLESQENALEPSDASDQISPDSSTESAEMTESPSLEEEIISEEALADESDTQADTQGASNELVDQDESAESPSDEPLMSETVTEEPVIEEPTIAEPSIDESSPETSSVEEERGDHTISEEPGDQLDSLENEIIPMSEADEASDEALAQKEQAHQEHIPSEAEQASPSQLSDELADSQEGQSPTSEDEDVFDFDASSHDENTTVYPEKQTVSDLMAKEEMDEGLIETSVSDETDSLDFHEADIQRHPQQNSPQDFSTESVAAESASTDQSSAESAASEVKSMMQPDAQTNGFSAFGWQSSQAQQAQAHAQAMNQQAQQAQMQAQAATAQAQQAQMQAHQAQAQAQQAQAQAQAQQAMNQQAMSQQMQQQGQMNYQPQYMPQQPMMGQMVPMQPGMPMPQGYPQQGFPQQPQQMQPPMGQMQPQQMQPGQWATYQGMAVQPVPLIPAQQGNFSAFSYSTPGQGANQQQQGFISYPYPVV